MTQVDCASERVFVPEATVCGHFAMAQDYYPRTFHKLMNRIPKLMLLFTLFWFVLTLIRRKTDVSVDIRTPLAGLLSFATSIGLIVNFLFKNHWGRPRPFQTLDAGRGDTYVLPGTISDQCDTNCSFVSGDVAAAFWMFWFVPLLPQKWRRPGFITVSIFAMGMSLMRVAQGRHYLSDVIVAALISLFVIASVNWLLSLWKPAKNQ